MIPIQAPTHCPSCSAELTWRNHLLYCVSASCTAQMQKKVEHFAKTLKIKGLGPSSIEKLGLSDIREIYCLAEDQIAECLSSPKIAAKLFAEIKNSESAPLEMVLPAFSIPLIGKTAANKLSSVITNIFDLSEDKCADAGLGLKATESLMDWYHWDFLGVYDTQLPFDFKFTEKSKDTITVTIDPVGVVCITGKLKSFPSKAEATKYLEHYGWIVKSTLTKDCTHLLNESGIESAKTNQARSKGITVVDNLGQLTNNGVI